MDTPSCTGSEKEKKLQRRHSIPKVSNPKQHSRKRSSKSAPDNINSSKIQKVPDEKQDCVLPQLAQKEGKPKPLGILFEEKKQILQTNSKETFIEEIDKFESFMNWMREEDIKENKSIILASQKERDAIESFVEEIIKVYKEKHFQNIIEQVTCSNKVRTHL